MPGVMLAERADPGDAAANLVLSHGSVNSLPEQQLAIGFPRIGGVVGDQDERRPRLPAEPEEEIDDGVAGVLVQVARRLVGQEEPRGFISARATATRWRSPPESWEGR